MCGRLGSLVVCSVCACVCDVVCVRLCVYGCWWAYVRVWLCIRVCLWLCVRACMYVQTEAVATDAAPTHKCECICAYSRNNAVRVACACVYVVVCDWVYTCVV